MHSQATRVGEVVGGKYRLVRLLGEGGMGSVYEARHDMIGRRFAVKFLHSELAGHGEILARFRREAQAAGSLENENIAAVTDFGSMPDGAPYIVMEFLEGADLAKVLAQTGPLPLARAAHILIQVCRGLVAAHARGIVHRDLKPENLLLQQRGDGGDLVKILDFGIAKLKSNEQHSDAATRTGVTMGTPYYMPPEQARGQKELDERADIYALGVILFELLSGRKPHNGENYNAILYSILMQAAPRIETYCPNLPPELAAVVHRAMAADANERYQSATELSQALAPFLGRALTPAPTISHASTVADAHVPTPLSNSTRAPVALTPALPLSEPKRSRAGLWLGVGAVVLGGAATGAWLVGRGAPGASVSAAALAAPPPAATPSSGADVTPTPTPEVTQAPPTAAATASASAAPAAAAPARAATKAPKPATKSASTPPQPAPAARPPAPRPATGAKADDDLFAP